MLFPNLSNDGIFVLVGKDDFNLREFTKDYRIYSKSLHHLIIFVLSDVNNIAERVSPSLHDMEAEVRVATLLNASISVFKINQ